MGWPSPPLFPRRVGQLHQVLLGVPVVLLPGRVQALLREAERLAPVLRGGLRRGRRGGEGGVAGPPLDRRGERVPGVVGRAAPGGDLGPPQLVVVAPLTLVVLAVEPLCLVDQV